MTADPPQEGALFQAAAQLTGSARESFLAAACQGNPGLRRRLDTLLEAHEQVAGAMAGTRPAEKPTLKIDFREDSAGEAVGQVIGRYKLLERIGEGGCGVVYVAEQTVPVRRRVALKVIKLGMDTKAVVARFEAERQALAMMDHPNIAKVLDAGATETGGQEAVKLWHVETGQELLTLRGKGSLLNEVEFAEGGDALLVGSRGQMGTWQLWSAPSWEEIAALEAYETTVVRQP